MEFIKYHGAHPIERGIIYQHAGQDALGQYLDTGAGRYLAVESHSVAHGLAYRLAQDARHSLGYLACGEATWLQHQDLVFLSCLDGEGQEGRLAGAWGCGDDEGLMGSQSFVYLLCDMTGR